MKTCIQCNSELDLASDNYSLYQVDGNRYLYCEQCQNLREPYISLDELNIAKCESDSLRHALQKARRNGLILLGIGCLMGYLFGG